MGWAAISVLAGQTLAQPTSARRLPGLLVSVPVFRLAITCATCLIGLIPWIGHAGPINSLGASLRTRHLTSQDWQGLERCLTSRSARLPEWMSRRSRRHLPWPRRSPSMHPADRTEPCQSASGFLRLIRERRGHLGTELGPGNRSRRRHQVRGVRSGNHSRQDGAGSGRIAAVRHSARNEGSAEPPPEECRPVLGVPEVGDEGASPIGEAMTQCCEKREEHLRRHWKVPILGPTCESSPPCRSCDDRQGGA